MSLVRRRRIALVAFFIAVLQALGKEPTQEDYEAVHEDGRAAYVICGEFSMWKGSIVHSVINKNQEGRWWPGERGMWDLLTWGPGRTEGTDNRLFIDE